MQLFSNLRRARTFAFVAALLIAPGVASAATFVSVNLAPPPIPVYEQPFAPGPDYIWIPGYWAYGAYGYYWVPGTWVLAPYVGALWTPGWWGWGGGSYRWHTGYWGPRVGYYGGINYGFGYFGTGYHGGYWDRGHFQYNTSVTRVDVNRVRNVYNRPVVRNDVRISYNGGSGGVRYMPNAEERLAERDTHRGATSVQTQHERYAGTRREQFATTNNGAPAMTATPRANAYNRSGPGDARVGHGPTGPQGARVETSRGERGGPQMTPHAGGPPQEHTARGQGGPQGKPEGGARHEGGGRHDGGGENKEGHPGR